MQTNARLPTLGWLAEALGTTPAALWEETHRLAATHEHETSPLDDPEFWERHRRRNESLLMEITDLRAAWSARCGGGRRATSRRGPARRQQADKIPASGNTTRKIFS